MERDLNVILSLSQKIKWSWKGNNFGGMTKKLINSFYLLSLTGMDSGTHGLWFTSKSKFIIIPLSDISNPEKASFKLDTEFKSPDMFIQKTIVNNKIVKTDTFNRVKN